MANLRTTYDAKANIAEHVLEFNKQEFTEKWEIGSTSIIGSPLETQLVAIYPEMPEDVLLAASMITICPTYTDLLDRLKVLDNYESKI